MIRDMKSMTTEDLEHQVRWRKTYVYETLKSIRAKQREIDEMIDIISAAEKELEARDE